MSRNIIIYVYELSIYGADLHQYILCNVIPINIYHKFGQGMFFGAFMYIQLHMRRNTKTTLGVRVYRCDV